jgi:molecular chaperone DnaK (HSP70)
MELEPIQHDLSAKVEHEPPAAPAPILPRALSISGVTPPAVMERGIEDLTVVVIDAGAELPAQGTYISHTTHDNQQELKVTVLEGDLPVAGLNTKLAELRLKLPPNVPASEQVCVHYTVDENSELTAELEVPSVNRRGSVRVSLKAINAQVHLFAQLEELYNRIGNKIRPEERAAMDRSRAMVEFLAANFRRVERYATDSELLLSICERLRAEATSLQDMMEAARKKCS